MTSRRRFLALSGTLGVSGLAGCATLFDSDEPKSTTPPETINSEYPQTVKQVPQLTAMPSLFGDLDAFNEDGNAYEDTHPYIGADDAPYLMHYFTDPACPFCARWERNTLPKIYYNYVMQGELKIVFRFIGSLTEESKYVSTVAYEWIKEQPDLTQQQLLQWHIDTTEASENDEPWGTKELVTERLNTVNAENIDAIMQAVENYNSYPSSTPTQNRDFAHDVGMTGTPFFIGVRADESVLNGSIRTKTGALPYAEFESMIEALKTD